MSKTTESLTLTYHHVYLVFSMIDLYCHGPIYFYYASAMTPEDIKLNLQTADYLMKTNRTHRKQFHDLYEIKPRTQEALDTNVVISISKDALNSIIRAFDVALLEAQKSNFYHLEIILNTSISEITKCLNVLKRYRQEINECIDVKNFASPQL